MSQHINMCHYIFTKQKETKQVKEMPSKKTTTKHDRMEDEDAEMDMVEVTNHNMFSFNIIGEEYIKKVAKCYWQCCHAWVWQSRPYPPIKDNKWANHMEFKNSKFRETLVNVLTQ